MDFDANANNDTPVVAVAKMSSSSSISSPTPQKRAAQPKAEDGRNRKKAKKTTTPPPFSEGGGDYDDDDDDDDEVDNLDIFGNGDIASHFFGFLHIKELFRFVFSSKEFMQRLTHKDVIRSALVNGGFAKTTVERLIPAIRTRSIWIPSPVRMLRLVNGKRCERCNERRANFGSKEFGVFFCWNRCMAGHTKGVQYNNKWSPFLDEPRIAASRYGGGYGSKAYIWTKPAKDTQGNHIGPLICKQQMEEAIKNKKTTSIESLLTPMDAIDPHAEDAETIVKEYTEFLADAERRVNERAAQKKETCKNNNDARKVKTEAFLAKLGEFLSDAPWKSIVLEYAWPTMESTYRTKAVARFPCQLVAALLDPLAAAPSKATNKKLREVADVISGAFTAVWSSNFHDFSWLAGSQVAYEQILYSHFTEKWSDKRVLQRISSKQVDLIQNGRLLEAVQMFVPEYCIFDLVQSSIMSTVGATDGPENSRAKQLAYRLWKEKRRGLDADSDDPPTAEPSDAYEQCLDDFPTLHQNVLDFLQDPETEAWKKKEEGTHAAKVEWVWYRVKIALIRNRDFPGILAAIDAAIL